jgi:glutamyl-tRNA synthetase
VEACRPWISPPRAPWPSERFNEGAFWHMAPLVQERVALLGEVPGMVDFLFLEEPEIDERSWESVVREEAASSILGAALVAYAECEWTSDALHTVTREIGESVGRKLNKAQVPIRVAITGRLVGPPLFESMAVLGREETTRRIDEARGRLELA